MYFRPNNKQQVWQTTLTYTYLNETFKLFNFEEGHFEKVWITYGIQMS